MDRPGWLIAVNGQWLMMDGGCASIDSDHPLKLGFLEAHIIIQMLNDHAGIRWDNDTIIIHWESRSMHKEPMLGHGVVHLEAALVVAVVVVTWVKLSTRAPQSGRRSRLGLRYPVEFTTPRYSKRSLISPKCFSLISID